MAATESTTCSTSSSPALQASDAAVVPPPLSPCLMPAAQCQEFALKQLPSWWRLVWCHERCHKQECEARRKSIGEVAKEARADLVCLKKASKFAMWMAQVQRPPYALLTDWREVKPCLQAAATQPLANQPAITIVLCELPRHYERASAWAQALPPHVSPVHVLQDAGLLRMLLADLVGRWLSGAALRSRGCLPQLLHGLPCAASYAPGAAVAMAQAAAPQWGVAPKACAALQAGRATLTMLPARGVPVMPCAGADAHKAQGTCRGQGAVSWPVAQVLSPVCGSQSPVQLEQLLREAMPDHYED